MIVSLSQVGHQFKNQWIFRDLTTTLKIGNKYAILGPNGSGKTTLLKIIAGALIPTVGELTYSVNGKEIKEDLFKHISFVAPYMENIEEFSVIELLRFNQKFKRFKSSYSEEAFLDEYQFTSSNKQIQDFSSGMKQRLKLAMALETPCNLLLLDEPYSNLDEKTIKLFDEKLSAIGNDQLVVIASNNKEEYKHCNITIDLKNLTT